jgi:hypothetical protein
MAQDSAPPHLGWMFGFPRYSQAGTDQKGIQTGSGVIARRIDPVASPGKFGLAQFWIFCFIIAEGLKSTTRRGEIGTSTPVFGFRPIRWVFMHTVNVPNDDSFTISSRAMASVISF